MLPGMPMKGYPEWVNWGRRTHPDWGQYYSMGEGPRLLKEKEAEGQLWCFLTMDTTWPDTMSSWGHHVTSSLGCHVTSHLKLPRHAAPAMQTVSQHNRFLHWVDFIRYLCHSRDKQLIHDLLSTVLHHDSLAQSRMGLWWRGLGKGFLSTFHSLWAQALEEHRTQ